jgi:hypothetical protein
MVLPPRGDHFEIRFTEVKESEMTDNCGVRERERKKMEKNAKNKKAYLLSMLVFWIVTPCGLVGYIQTLRRNKLFSLSGLKMETFISSRTVTR